MTGSQDDDFREPYVDSDEWRDTPVRHRYVHGGFADNATRFSLYFPPSEQYRGRFFQHITPIPDSEHLAQTAHGQADRIGFAIASGGYFVETNGGGPSGEPGSPVDPSIAGYRANAAVAEYSRVLAQRVYADNSELGDLDTRRPYGYAYGGSGGAYRTIAGAEQTKDVWDGFVPYVPGSPMAIPNVFSVRMHAQRILRDRLDGIVDAGEPGGSGDPFAGLSDEQRAALTEVTGMGFPPRSWFGHRTMGGHAFSVLYPNIVATDPAYFTEFWTEPGYLGADPAASVHQARVRLRAEITAVITRGEAAGLGLRQDGAPAALGGVDNAFAADVDDAIIAVRLSSPAPAHTQGAELTVRTGAAAGTGFALRTVGGDLAVFDEQDHRRTPDGLRAGDVVEIDNSNFLAAQTYHRHQVPGREYAVWDQFRDQDGTPRFPQRPFLIGPLFTSAAGAVPTGNHAGKMIVVACLLDREAFPWQADWYRSRVREQVGEDNFRLWYVDNALHGDDELQEDPTHTVSYLGVLHEALRQLAAWVETGQLPAESSTYTIHDGQIQLPATATDRHGVQPTIDLTVNGAARADVQPGEQFTLRAVAETPPDTGPVVTVSWDLDGTGEFGLTEHPTPANQVTLERHHAITTPGTHFLTVRVSTQRDADPSTPFARIDNLARVRVVVRD